LGNVKKGTIEKKINARGDLGNHNGKKKREKKESIKVELGGVLPKVDLGGSPGRRKESNCEKGRERSE